MTKISENERAYPYSFQYRKRYEVTCDFGLLFQQVKSNGGFNTASGMRSHVTKLIVTFTVRNLVSIPQAV